MSLIAHTHSYEDAIDSHTGVSPECKQLMHIQTDVYKDWEELAVTRKRMQWLFFFGGLLRDHGIANWDGDGAKALSNEAAANALQFLIDLPKNIVPPDVFALKSGDIGMQWNGKREIISVTIKDDYTVIYTILIGKHDRRSGFSRMITTVPTEILSGLRVYFSIG